MATGAMSVIVVTHNSEPLLEPFASSLDEALAKFEQHEVVVVDSGSTDSSVHAARRLLPGARVIELGWNAGYAASINRGVAARSLTGPMVVLNPDTRPHRESLALLVAALGVGVGISVPRLVDDDGRILPSLRRRPTIARAFGEALLGGGRAGRSSFLGEVVRDPDAYERPGSFDWASGAAMCISAECSASTGEWNESFFLYSEETDFALRARDAGFALHYVPDAVVYHKAGDAHTSPQLFALLTVNRAYVFRMRHGRVASAFFWLALVLNSALRSLARSNVHRAALVALFRPRDAVVAAARKPRP